MILRRVIEHVKAQNWTAIGIDFVIVVLGVFVGIQLGNWNEARALRAQESAQLAQLRDELIANNRALEFQMAYTSTSIESGRRALAYLESNEPCASRCDDLLIDFFHASQLWGTAFETAHYRENERLGFPTDPATRAAVELFYLAIAWWDPVNLTAPAYRERVRGHISPDAAVVLWDRCFTITEDQFEVLSRDCAPELAGIDSAAILQSIRRDARIADDLRFWLGQNIFALEEYPNARQDAAEAIDAINAELGDER
jgi:hypothetical protein